MNFRNQRLGHHLAADYTIIMSRTLKVTGNHVMYDRGAWFLTVIMSSSRALCCLPSAVMKQNHDFQVCFVVRARHRKSSWRQGLRNTKRSTKVAKKLFAYYVKEKNWENLRKRKSWHNFENILCRIEKERIRSMYNKTIIRFGFFDIQNNQGLGKGYQPQPSASVDNLYLDLDYSGYQKNLIQ